MNFVTYRVGGAHDTQKDWNLILQVGISLGSGILDFM